MAIVKKGGGMVFIDRNPTVPLPTGEADSATIRPILTSGHQGQNYFGAFAKGRAFLPEVFAGINHRALLASLTIVEDMRFQLREYHRIRWGRRPAYPSNDTLGLLRLFSSSSINKPCPKLAQPIRATSSTQTISTWVRWIGGSLLSILISVWTHKYWRNLQMIEGEAEVVLEEVDNAAKMVEKAATMAEKVSANVAEKLPTHTKLKEIALLIERVSKLAAQDAELTHQFVHKVDALKEDLEYLEKLLKPAIDEIENYEHERELLTTPIQTK